MANTNPLKVTLYSLPNCQQCVATERRLKAKEIPYEKIDISEDEQAATVARGLGSAAPIVVVPFDSATLAGRNWSGFRPDLIDQLTA